MPGSSSSTTTTTAGMLSKKEHFKMVTPIPGFIPRQLAIDILHSHSEVITLNPLVLDHRPIPAPRDAPRDEYFSTWYEITERIQYVPGLGKMGSGKIRFNGCFHDMPWGLQTHIYAPLNVDLKNTYRIAGNQPGVEPPQPLEMGLGALGAPADGLYLLEDIEIRANITVIGFVKAELKRAGGEMVKRIIKKAELLDAGILQAMMQDGRLKTINPADRSAQMPSRMPSPSPGGSSVGLDSARSSIAPSMSPAVHYKALRPESYLTVSRPGTAPSFSAPHSQQQSWSVAPPAAGAAEMMGTAAFPTLVEMPGDFYHPQPPPRQQAARPPPSSQQSSPGLPPDARLSPDQSSPLSGRWSAGVDFSRPASVASTATGGSAGYPSPGLDHKGFATELQTHQEASEDQQTQQASGRDEAGALGQRQEPGRIPHSSHFPAYNPADYAQVTEQYRKNQAAYGQNGPLAGDGAKQRPVPQQYAQRH